jgi:transcriptional regulator
MYIPAHFAETDVAALHRAIVEWPLGAMIVATPSGMVANHVPFELDSTKGAFGTLRCHVARNNDVWRHPNAECLVIFAGPSAYISPNLYPTKKEHGKVVPTYNYAVVHAHGRLAIHDDVKWLRGLVGRLTNRFEASQTDPWKMGDAPREYIDEQLEQIVGIEIEIARLEGKWKMSQNRPAIDKASVVTGLKQSASEADREVARMVEEQAEKR